MKKFKDIKAIKTNPEPAKGKNVDPGQLGQYSAKHQVSESTASLNQYLSSRGINPKFVSTATKIAHSKSAQFIKWQQDHMQRREDVQPTEFTPEETVNEISMDNISPMMQAHVKKGRMGSVNVGTRMASPKPTFKPKPKPKKVGFFKRLFAGEEVQLEAKASKPTALDRFRAAAAARVVKHNNIEKERQERLHKEPSASNSPHRDVKKDGMSDAIRRLEKHMNKEEVELEESTGYEKTLKTTTYTPYKSHKGIEVSSKKAKTPKNLHQKYGEDYHIYHGTMKNKNGSGKEKSFVVHDRPLDVKFMHKHSDEEKEAILHHLNKNKHLDTSAFHKSQIPEEVELDEMINEVLGKDASAGDWIHDFIHSDNPKFAGKSKAERKKMALGAYYGKQNEEVEQIDEITQSDLDKSAEKEVAHAKKNGWKVQKQTYGRTYTHPKHGHIDMDRYGEWQHRPASGISRGKGNLIAHGEFKDLDKHISSLKEEVEQIDELKKSTVFSWLKQQPVVPEKKPGMDKKSHNKKIKTHNKSWNRALDRLSGYKPTSEDMWQDTQAATQTPADGANGGNQVADRKRQMSKSARMIKDLYKRKGVVKEDMHDHEKEDKSVATYGKKPKMSQADKKDSLGENKPQAAATLTGGTTLTGVKRDSIEIDPIMRNRPGQPNIDKKSGKKENNKNDK